MRLTQKLCQARYSSEPFVALNQVDCLGNNSRAAKLIELVIIVVVVRRDIRVA
jgi:hypothetical protein